MSAAPVDEAVRSEIHSNLDECLCVEAGAGTGKTTSLVGRIVELLASGRAEVDALVVITFTEKAAAELSARVREALEDGAEGETDPERRDRIEAASRALYRARIETIHTFAANLLRERPVEAGLDPGFAVMSRLEAELSFDTAYADWLDRLMSGEHPDVERSLNLGFGTLEIEEAARTLHAHRYLLPLASFGRPAADAGELVRWLDTHLVELHAICDACLDEDDRGVTQLARLFAFDARLRDEGTAAFARERLVALAAPGLRETYGRKDNWEDAERCARMKELVAEYAALRDELRSSLRAVALLGLLPHLEEFVREYEEERRAHSVADFDDLLIWARDLVRDNGEVRQYFQRRVSALLIDEFQDTDPIQVELAALLTAEDEENADWRSAQPAPGKLFVVGDPKQSIYRFRRADIGIYDEVKRDLLDGGLRRLSQNFRSLPGVIAWVNRVFDSLLEERPGVQPANVPLEAVDLELPLKRPPVIVVRGGNDQLDATGVREAEARATASLLRAAVIDERWPVRDRATGEVRDASWRDVAILLPTRTGLDAYEEALALAGVPYRHEGSRDYFRRQEVRDLISLLRSIDDPSDRLSLVGALRSSAFGCSDEDLVVHLGSGGAWDYRVTTAEGQSDAVSEAFQILRALHRARGRLSLSELVQRVIEESRLVEFALTLPDGPQAAANLLAIMDGARAFTAAGGGGLRAFTRYLADSTENEAVEVDAGIAEETDDVVRLLTIHGAKGLEFPIVVLANLGSGVQTSREPVPDEAERRLHFRVGSGGRGRSGHYSTPGFDERWESESAALDAERVRLLYVAATRARDHLVVPFIRGKRKPGPFLAALGRHLPEEQGHEVEVDGAWLLDADQLPDAPLDERIPAPVGDEEVEWALAGRETWITDHEELTRVARAELPFVVASSMERAGRPLSAEASHSGATLLVSEGPPLPVGDALHLVMERVTLPDAADLDDVVSAVCLEAAIPERVDEVLEMARRCLASPAVRRALESKEWWREVPFTVEADGGFEVGRVDLLFRDEGELVVVDYKSDVVAADAAAAHAKEHHGGQAVVYSNAMANATGERPAAVVFVMARSGVEVTLRPGQSGDGA